MINRALADYCPLTNFPPRSLYLSLFLSSQTTFFCRANPLSRFQRGFSRGGRTSGNSTRSRMVFHGNSRAFTSLSLFLRTFSSVERVYPGLRKPRELRPCQGDLRWSRAVIGLAENKFAWCEASCLQRSRWRGGGTRVSKLTASSVATPPPPPRRPRFSGRRTAGLCGFTPDFFTSRLPSSRYYSSIKLKIRLPRRNRWLRIYLTNS